MSVYDTSAVLAIIYGEEGRETASASLGGSVMSVVSVAEVARDVIASGRGDSGGALRYVTGLGIQIVPPTAAEACRAGELKRNRGLSLADCFCIALGEARNEPLITGDQQWARVPDIRVPIELIR